MHLLIRSSYSLTTYEACVFQHLFLSVLLSPQVSKGVNDDTKNQVLNDDDNDNQEERQIIQKSDEKQRLLQKTKSNIYICNYNIVPATRTVLSWKYCIVVTYIIFTACGY